MLTDTQPKKALFSSVLNADKQGGALGGGHAATRARPYRTGFEAGDVNAAGPLAQAYELVQRRFFGSDPGPVSSDR